jgi:uncharacterized protein YjbI with pentapeptide repeats
MANPEHIEIVKQGTGAISRWRNKNPRGRLELSKASLVGINAPKADFSDANLYGAILMGGVPSSRPSEEFSFGCESQRLSDAGG